MKINVDFNSEIGRIKAMHAVGQPPMIGISDTYMHYLTEANIPFSRLHDVGGRFGANTFVDIPNIFRDFDADENNPDSYDFAFTDILLEHLKNAECMPIFRLGVTIENYQHIRAYRIAPPKDFEKWARICEHIIRHYNYGWADGYEYNIKYWEIWNEPDFDPDINKNQMWHGTMNELFELYEVTAKHLKTCFGDDIKVGGYGACGFYPIDEEHKEPRWSYFPVFFKSFLDYVKKTQAPLDFFSYHSYTDVKNTVKMDDFVCDELSKRGYVGVETLLDEWNNVFDVKLRGTSFASAVAADMMLAMQDKSTDILCYYDARIGASLYSGMFNPLTYEPFCTYYSFKAFGEMYRLGKQVKVDIDEKTEEIRAVASTDGKGCAVMISNVGEDRNIQTNLNNMTVKLIDAEHNLTDTDFNSSDFVLKKNQVVLITSK